MRTNVVTGDVVDIPQLLRYTKEYSHACQVPGCRKKGRKRAQFMCHHKNWGRTKFVLPLCLHHFKLLSGVIMSDVGIKWSDMVILKQFIKETPKDDTRAVKGVLVNRLNNDEGVEV